MPIERIVNSVFGSCSYLIDDGDGGVWMVDCGDVEPVVRLLRGRVVRGVLLTHGHFDHIYGLNELCKLFPDAIVYTNAAGRDALLDAKLNLSKYHETPFVFNRPQNIRLSDEGERITLSESMTAEVLATPGHNPSCLTYMVGSDLFTCDAYIPGSKVVTNLPGSDKHAAASSLTRLIALVPTKTLHPGHFV